MTFRHGPVALGVSVGVGVRVIVGVTVGVAVGVGYGPNPKHSQTTHKSASITLIQNGIFS